MSQRQLIRLPVLDQSHLHAQESNGSKPPLSDIDRAFLDKIPPSLANIMKVKNKATTRVLGNKLYVAQQKKNIRLKSVELEKRIRRLRQLETLSRQERMQVLL